MAGVSQSGKSIVKRAMEKPEKIGMLVDMLKSKGISTTIRQIKDINEEGKPSGYSLSGIVVTSGTPEFSEGDRVSAAVAGLLFMPNMLLYLKIW